VLRNLKGNFLTNIDFSRGYRAVAISRESLPFPFVVAYSSITTYNIGKKRNTQRPTLRVVEADGLIEGARGASDAEPS